MCDVTDRLVTRRAFAAAVFACAVTARARGRRARVGVWLLTLLAAGAAAQPPQERAEAAGEDLIGTPAPALVVETIDGNTIALGALYGRTAVYLKFWATWCVPCLRQMPHFQGVQDSAGPDLVVLGVNTGFNDSLPDVRAVIEEASLTMPTVIDDGRLAAAFNLRVTPQHVVIGRDGRIDHIGFFADGQLDAALHAARAADPASPAGAAPPIASAAGAELSIGNELPDLSAVTLDGRTFRTLEATAGRATVLVFMSPWCESYLASSRPAIATSCRQVREQIAELASGNDAVRWLGVSSGLWATEHDLRAYEEEYAPRIPLMLDESGEWFRAFDVMHTPTIVIADADGAVVNRVQGFDADLADAIGRIP